MKYTPEKYQKKAIKLGLERATFGFFLDPGLGKTSIALSMIVEFIRSGLIIIVVAPLKVIKETWPDEIAKWDQFKGIKYGLLNGPRKEKVLQGDYNLFLITPEGVPWLADQISRMDFFPAHVLFIDESSKFKNQASKRFKILKPLLPMFDRRYIMTGSPAPNSLLNLFAQIFILDLGNTFSPYITKYREKYFFPTGFGGYTWALKPGADEQIYEAIAPKVLRMSAEDYLDLPEIIGELGTAKVPSDKGVVSVTLDDKTMAIYKTLEDSLRLDFESGTVAPKNSAIATMQCEQIANGALYITEPQLVNGRAKNVRIDTKELHELKLDALEEIIDELQGQQAFIGYHFEHDYEAILKRFGLKGRMPSSMGFLNGKEDSRLKNGWNDGSITCLFAPISSASHGLNLQGVQTPGVASKNAPAIDLAGREHLKTVIYYYIPWSWESYDQFRKRVSRKGQGARVMLRHLVAKGTVDEAKIIKLRMKQDGEHALLDALREYWAKR